MERKGLSKFFSFISNFLKVSFLSAIVALGFSCNSFIMAMDATVIPDISRVITTSTDVGTYYDATGSTYTYVSLDNIVYAIKQEGSDLKATGIYYNSTTETQKMTIPSSLSWTSGGTSNNATVVGVIPNLLNKISDNGELILPNGSVKLITANAGAASTNTKKVYVSVEGKTTAPDTSFDAWAKAVNAKDATVTLKDLGAQYVSYKSGDKLSDIKSKLSIDPPTDATKGTWDIKSDKDATKSMQDTDVIPEGTQKLSFSFTAAQGSDYKDVTTPIEITLKDEKEEPKGKEAISCKDFNIKANVSGNNPTLKDVQLPSGDDTKVVDSSGNKVSGTWKWSDESKSVAKFENTDCEAVFTPTDTEKYQTITKSFKVYNVGKEKTFGDYTFSVSGDGVTNGTVSGKGITWVRESSGGTAAWYGFDNSDGVFPEGATVAVRWIGAKENPEEYAKYVDEAKASGKLFEDDKLWVFEVKAFDSDMNEIKDFGKDEGGNPKKINFYIESGDDWDPDDVIAFFVDTEGGNPEFWDVSLDTKTINGEEKEFIVAKLSHLSVHFVGDEKKAQDVLSDLQKVASEAGTKYKLEHPDASLQDLQKVQFEAMQKAYEQLSDDDKKLVADYAEFLQKSDSEDSGSSSDSKVTPQSDSSSSGSSSSTQKSSTSSSPYTTTSSSKIKTGSDVSNLMFLMQCVFGTSLGTAIISRKKKFD